MGSKLSRQLVAIRAHFTSGEEVTLTFVGRESDFLIAEED
jgi:hypothetical protein